ncbi:MAG: hypothetical protein AAF226_04425 [Verrucomicrobiota bacterium]
MIKIFPILFVIGSLFTAIAEPRTWTATDGRTLVADYLGSDGESVKIKITATGATFDIPLTRLSDADREWVKEELERIEPVTGPYANLLNGEWQEASHGKLPYSIYGKDLDARKKYPIVIFMHGKSKEKALGQQLGAITKKLTDETFYAKHPSIVIAPALWFGSARPLDR